MFYSFNAVRGIVIHVCSFHYGTLKCTGHIKMYYCVSVKTSLREYICLFVLLFYRFDATYEVEVHVCSFHYGTFRKTSSHVNGYLCVSYDFIVISNFFARNISKCTMFQIKSYVSPRVNLCRWFVKLNRKSEP